MALHRYGDFRVDVFYFDSPCRRYCIRDSLLHALYTRRSPNPMHVYCTLCLRSLVLIGLHESRQLLQQSIDLPISSYCFTWTWAFSDEFQMSSKSVVTFIHKNCNPQWRIQRLPMGHVSQIHESSTQLNSTLFVPNRGKQSGNKMIKDEKWMDGTGLHLFNSV